MKYTLKIIFVSISIFFFAVGCHHAPVKAEISKGGTPDKASAEEVLKRRQIDAMNTHIKGARLLEDYIRTRDPATFQSFQDKVKLAQRQIQEILACCRAQADAQGLEKVLKGQDALFTLTMQNINEVCDDNVELNGEQIVLHNNGQQIMVSKRGAILFILTTLAIHGAQQVIDKLNTGP